MTEASQTISDPDPIEFMLPCLQVRQPIGDLYLLSMPHDVLCRIAYFDVRRVLQEDRDVERYLGIQRPLNDKRVKEIEAYVNYVDATFPTAVILAVDAQYAQYDREAKTLRLSNVARGERKPSIALRQLARVIDGQHRIAGLFEFRGKEFAVPVTLFVGSDISDQAYVFATVNLEQTRVSKSLAYDLFSLAKSRSPQKTCHNIAVALDRDEGGPFYRRIKRLGIATEGRDFETIAQAQFVEAVLGYISRTSKEVKEDRDKLIRGQPLTRADQIESHRLPFRNMFIDERDIDITQLIHNYFSAVREIWTEAWEFRGERQVLNRTNGFRALMRLFRDLYLELGIPGDMVPKAAFAELLSRAERRGLSFSRDDFPPGSTGESALYRELREQILRP